MMKQFLITVAGIAILSPSLAFGAQQTSNIYGKFPGDMPSGASFATFNLIGNDDGVACIMRAPGDGSGFTIRSIGFRVSAVATTSEETVAIETVSSTSGFPSGSLWAAGTSATTSVSALGWHEVTLGSDAVIAAGDYFAVTVRNPAASGGNITVVRNIGGDLANTFPYCATFAGTGSWSKTAGALSAFYVGNNTGVGIKGLYNAPIMTTNNVNTNSGTTPDEVGNVFQFNNPVKLSAVAFAVRLLSASATLMIYDASDTVLASSTWNLNNAFSTQGASIYWQLATPLTLTANSNYRVTIQSVSASNIVATSYPYNSTTTRSVHEYADTFMMTQRTDAGAWTNITTSTYAAHLYISSTDDGVSAGGGGSVIQQGWVVSVKKKIDNLFAPLFYGVNKLAQLMGKLTFALK